MFAHGVHAAGQLPFPVVIFPKVCSTQNQSYEKPRVSRSNKFGKLCPAFSSLESSVYIGKLKPIRSPARNKGKCLKLFTYHSPKLI